MRHLGVFWLAMIMVACTTSRQVEFEDSLKKVYRLPKLTFRERKLFG